MSYRSKKEYIEMELYEIRVQLNEYYQKFKKIKESL